MMLWIATTSPMCSCRRTLKWTHSRWRCDAPRLPCRELLAHLCSRPRRGQGEIYDCTFGVASCTQQKLTLRALVWQITCYEGEGLPEMDSIALGKGQGCDPYVSVEVAGSQLIKTQVSHDIVFIFFARLLPPCFTTSSCSRHRVNNCAAQWLYPPTEMLVCVCTLCA